MTGNRKSLELLPHLPQNGLIELEGVSMHRSGRMVLDNINLSVNEGDFVAITGPNGGGKTTLLRLILKLLKPTRGKVLYRQGGKETKSLKIGYLPQKNLIDSRFPITVHEVIASGLLAESGLSGTERAERIERVTELVGLTSHATNAIGALSGGQLQRTLLGRAIISKPPVLVLDEPLSYVDKHFEHRIYDIMADLATHTTILLVSHEMSAIAGMANRHLIVDRSIRECNLAHHFSHSGCDDYPG